MLTASQAAAVLGLSTRKVYDLAASGRLPCYRVGREVVFDAAAVEQYKASCRVEPTPPPPPQPPDPAVAEYEERRRRQAEEIAAWLKGAEQREKLEKKRQAEQKAIDAYTRTERRAALVRHHASRRRVQKLKRTPPWANQAAIRKIYAEAMRLTLETGEMHHVDHIIPLQGALVSGLHVENNLQVLHWRENVQKNNKFEAA